MIDFVIKKLKYMTVIHLLVTKQLYAGLFKSINTFNYMVSAYLLENTSISTRTLKYISIKTVYIYIYIYIYIQTLSE